jgi:fructuronate reductase
LDTLLESDPRWAICGAGLRSAGLAEVLEAQDCLYTVAELDAQVRFRVIGSLKEYLLASRHAERIFARLASPEVRLVTLTVTEKGYCLDAGGALDFRHPDIVHDLKSPAAPVSAIGWIAEGLARRKAFGLAPFVAMSCDNIVGNGRKLRNAVLSFAEAKGDRDLTAWIGGEARFPNTMVDSITPAADKALKQLVGEALGLHDEAPVQRESFIQWVIEDILGPDAPDLASVGARLTDDVEAYEQAKIRLLNGTHSALAYIGLLWGHESVGDAVKDSRLGNFVARLMHDDIAPSLRVVRDFDLKSYIETILARLRNPALTHRLAQIACDGTQKMPQRFMAVIADAIAAGRSIERLVVPIAAWMLFVVRETKSRRPLDDPLADALWRIGEGCTGDSRVDLPRFLGLAEVFPAELVREPGFVSTLRRAYDDLDSLVA